MSPAQRVALVLTASAAAVPMLAQWEGRPAKGYVDLGGVATSCYGHTGPDVVVGRVYSDHECMGLLAQDAVKHGVEIDRCIKVAVPTESRAAFTSFAYNVGTAAFCGSTLARKLNAGDLAGACAELSRWSLVKGKPVQGLVNRRRVERAECERGLGVKS